MCSVIELISVERKPSIDACFLSVYSTTVLQHYGRMQFGVYVDLRGNNILIFIVAAPDVSVD